MLVLEHLLSLHVLAGREQPHGLLIPIAHDVNSAGKLQVRHAQAVLELDGVR